jgi:hypothetical protein
VPRLLNHAITFSGRGVRSCPVTYGWQMLLNRLGRWPSAVVLWLRYVVLCHGAGWYWGQWGFSNAAITDDGLCAGGPCSSPRKWPDTWLTGLIHARSRHHVVRLPRLGAELRFGSNGARHTPGPSSRSSRRRLRASSVRMRRQSNHLFDRPLVALIARRKRLGSRLHRAVWRVIDRHCPIECGTVVKHVAVLCP